VKFAGGRGSAGRKGGTSGEGPRSVLHRAEELAATLPPLLVAAERVATTVSQGVHGRRRVGQGETFWQFRPYQPGDSTQQIDWRQSAKSQRLYIRQTEWEAAQSVWLWRDASPSMFYRSSDLLPAKAGRAELLLLAVASLLARGGERFALLGDYTAPAAGRAALRRLAASVEQGRGGAGSLPSVEPLPRYARVVIFSDLLSSLEDINAAIGGFAEFGVRGHLVQVLDPAEETLPFSGRVLFEGLETEGSVLFGRVESVRDDYRAAIDAHLRGLQALARMTGWTLLTHRTDQPPETSLMALFLALSETTKL
jgi:uncharacterized protein (DUF58 family)